MRGAVETTSEHLMVGQVLIAVPGRRVVGQHATRVLKKREGRLPCRGRAVQPVLRCPVIALAGRGGGPVATRKPSQIVGGHGAILIAYTSDVFVTRVEMAVG